MLIEKILYAKEIEVGKELAIGRWIKAVTTKKDNALTWEAIGKWDEGRDGDFGCFINEYVAAGWFLLGLSN